METVPRQVGLEEQSREGWGGGVTGSPGQGTNLAASNRLFMLTLLKLLQQIYWQKQV